MMGALRNDDDDDVLFVCVCADVSRAASIMAFASLVAWRVSVYLYLTVMLLVNGK